MKPAKNTAYYYGYLGRLVVLFLFRFDNAEAKVVVPVIGVAPALVAHLAVVGVVVPAAAAVIAVAASAGIPEILVQVSAPLPNVAAHVV